MAETNIEWTDYTFNPWIGCTKVSPACDHCYAETQNDFRKWNAAGWGPHADRKRTSPANWRKPLSWNRKAEGAASRPRVFCASLADVFDNHRSILPAWRDDLRQLIGDTPNLDWLLLTKRPQNMKRFAPWRWGKYPHNVWIGTTVENQDEANRRIWPLLQTPARVRFLSCEPMLGPIDLTQVRNPYGETFNALTGEIPEIKGYTLQLDWIIAGGESGAQARPTNPQWFRDLRDQCTATDTPFLFKQWGEWVSVSEVEGPGAHHRFPDGRTVRRTGKKRAGRTLEHVLHDGFPEPRQ